MFAKKEELLMPLIEISDLLFPAFNKAELENIPAAYGLEIFYEFGGNAYWDQLLDRMQTAGRPFSIHGPCVTVNLADTNDTAYLERYEETFAYARKRGAAFVVVHTNEQWHGQRKETQELVKKRLHCIERLAQRMQGAVMVIENVGLKQYNLFNEEEYAALLAKFPTAKALIDVGHGQVNGWDLCRLVRTLGPRIAAFHLHDNDGESDQHLPIGTSTIEWQHLLPAIKTYAPEAVWVLEYANGDFKTAEALMRHIETVRGTWPF